MNLDLHPRTLRRNIWTGLLSASDQEIRDGMDFYPGAHGLCRLFAKIFDTTSDQVAGIYAALSPMNGWYTNVANVLDVLRWLRWDRARVGIGNFSIARLEDELPKVNTSKANRNKALLIAWGSDPLYTLRGKKVTAFYRAIAEPDNISPIPVDRPLNLLSSRT